MSHKIRSTQESMIIGRSNYFRGQANCLNNFHILARGGENMTKGAIVQRKSYGQDITFRIVHVFPYEKLAILEAINDHRRFFADSSIEDLVEVIKLPSI